MIDIDQKNDAPARIKPATRCLQVVLLLSCVWFGTFGALAQGVERAVRGRVVDTQEKAVPGARIALRSQETGREWLATADSKGEFVFTAVRAGSYEIAASAQGFSRAVQPLDTAAETVLRLSPAAVSAEVTVVSGSRQEELRESLNTKVDVVGRAAIRDTGYETVAEVLREVPGVLTRRGSETAGAAGEQVQGLDSRQVLVLQDGQPLLGARGIKRGVLNLDRQSTNRLEQVEVVKGASSALYGSDAIGGVINLITREPKLPFESTFSASGGNFGIFDTRGDAGFRHGKWNGFFSLERHKNNGFDLTPTTLDTTGAAFHRYDVYGKVKYQPAPNFFLTGTANSYWNNARGRSVGEEGTQLDNIDEEAQNYSLAADWAINARTNLQARGYFARFDEITRSRLASTGRELPGNLFERYGKFDVTFSRVLGERQFLQAGGELITDKYRGLNRLRDDAGNSADTRNLWLQDKITVGNRLTVTVGGRYDHHSIFGSAVSPKVALNFRVTDSLRLRSSWGRGFRAPDLGQLYFRFLNPTNFYQVIGNPNLSPEHAGSWQAGGEYATRGRRVRFGLNFYRNDVRNLIDSVSLGFVATQAQLNAIIQREGIDPLFRPVTGRLLFLYKNLSNVFTEGVEADGAVALPYGFNVSGAYTYLNAWDKDRRVYLTGRHKHQGTVRFTYDHARAGFRANLRGTFYSKWIVSRTATSETVTPGFPLWDVYAAKTLVKRLEVFGAVDNMFDNQDSNTGLVNATNQPLPINRAEAGRTFRLGLRWAFSRE